MTKTLEFTPENKIAQLWVLLRYLEQPHIRITVDIDEGIPSEKMKTYKNNREITGEFSDVSSLIDHLNDLQK